MLKVMRQHAKYFYVLFFIVILSFIFWGTGGIDENGSAEPLVRIGEETVSVQEYWRAYESMSDLYRDIYGADFDPEKMGLKDKVLNTIVDELILLEAAKEAGITITDRELQDAIVNNPAFIRDGAFNKDVYVNLLRQNGMTPSQYEASKRRELMLADMRRLIEESVALTPHDVRGLPEDEEAYKALRETLLEAKRGAAVKAFVSAMKKKVPVAINKQLIS